jgi:hypothetical protein
VVYSRATRCIVLCTLAITTVGCSASPTAAPSPTVAASVVESAEASSVAATPIATAEQAGWVVSEMPFPDGAEPCVPNDGGVQNLLVAGFGSGLIALGSCAHSASPSLVWMSADGRSWEASAPAALAHADVYQLLVVDGLIVATGQDVSDGATATAWSSRDGVSWTHSKGDLGCGVMSSVTRSGSEFVAFGNRVPEVPEFGVPPGVCEWLSADGLTWAPVSLPKAVFPHHAVVGSVAAGPDGLIAVGIDSNSGGALWRSPDGRVWTRVASPWAAAWGSMDVAVPLGRGFVVLGSDAHGNEALAVSVDGIAWTAAAAPGQGTLYGVPALAAGPAGVAFGGVLINGAPSPAGVWTSSDGLRWVPAPALPPEFPADPHGLAYHSVAVIDDTYAVGASTADGNAAVVTLKP